MKYNFIILFFTIAAIIITIVPSSAGISSSSFQIPTSVFSGGGIPMSSASFQTNSTLGQPSPITGPILNTHSRVESGFWKLIYYVST